MTYILSSKFKGKNVGVLCSGGDSQGMNAALRTIVRFGTYLGINIYIIKNGYSGLLSGGDKIIKASASDVNNILSLSGTIIGTSRSPEFKEISHRLTAAFHLIQRNISSLIVIGGEGSLTGAQCLVLEWSSYLTKLLNERKISNEEKNENDTFTVVGLLGSIDNDVCGSESSIGADSALLSILDSIETLRPIALSMSSIFVIEVMGRECGYLALASSLLSEAVYVFIPECPPSTNWPQELQAALEKSHERAIESQAHFIILSEGACDDKGKPILAKKIIDVIAKFGSWNVRSIVLGHLQRGGFVSSFDRLLATRMAVEAILCVLEDRNHSSSFLMALEGNEIVRKSLTKCLQETKDLTAALKSKNFKTAIRLRGPHFRELIDLRFQFHSSFSSFSSRSRTLETESRLRFAVMTLGKFGGGVNAAVYSFVRTVISEGHVSFGVYDGIQGLLNNKVKELTLRDVCGLLSQKSAFLGESESKGETFESIGQWTLGKRDSFFSKIESQISKYKLKGLLLIGDSEAYTFAEQFAKRRYEGSIPIVLLPASAHNDVPGTELSLGVDTALNALTTSIDDIFSYDVKTLVNLIEIPSSKKRVGALTALTALTTGASFAYIAEKPFDVKDLVKDLSSIKVDDGGKTETPVILIQENGSTNYDMDFISRLIAQESQIPLGKKISCFNLFGSSAVDRRLGLEWSHSASISLITSAVFKRNPCHVFGRLGKELKLSLIQNLKEDSFCWSKSERWKDIYDLIKILSTYHESQ